MTSKEMKRGGSRLLRIMIAVLVSIAFFAHMGLNFSVRAADGPVSWQVGAETWNEANTEVTLNFTLTGGDNVEYPVNGAAFTLVSSTGGWTVVGSSGFCLPPTGAAQHVGYPLGYVAMGNIFEEEIDMPQSVSLRITFPPRFEGDVDFDVVGRFDTEGGEVVFSGPGSDHPAGAAITVTVPLQPCVCAYCDDCEECVYCGVCDCCYECEYCDDCEECVVCGDCECCYECEYCDDCEECVVCGDCECCDCVYCEECEACVYCGDCDCEDCDCVYCEECEVCVLCGDCECEDCDCVYCEECEECVYCGNCECDYEPHDYCEYCEVCGECEVCGDCECCDCPPCPPCPGCCVCECECPVICDCEDCDCEPCDGCCECEPCECDCCDCDDNGNGNGGGGGAPQTGDNANHVGVIMSLVMSAGAALLTVKHLKKKGRL